MTSKPTTPRFPRWPLGKRATAILAAGLVMLAVAVGVISWRSLDATAQPGSVAKLWPPFTMTYTYRRFDPDTGVMRFDQEYRLVVNSEYDWRNELIYDGLEPAEVGSFSEFKNGILSTHSALLNTYNQTRIDEGIVAVSRVLDPELFSRAMNKIQPGWEMVPAAPEDAAVPSAPDGTMAAVAPEERVAMEKTDGGEYLRVEVDKTTVDDPVYKGAIPVSAESRWNGRVVETYEVTSLEIAP